jgi:streptogramin lyase
VEYFGNKLGHLDPSTGIFQEWTIPTPGANPYSIATTTVSGSLAVWGTEFGGGKGNGTIFAFFPYLSLFREYNLFHGSSGVTYISVEPSTGQVRVWFTESFGDLNGEFIYDPKTSNVTLYEDEFPAAAGGGAYGVFATSDSVWFAGFSALVRWDRSSEQYTVWPFPVHGYSVGRLVTVDQFGEPWYTQGATDANGTDNYVGVLRPNNTIQEWHISSPGADPRGISLNPLTQQPWIAEESQQAGNGAIAALNTFAGGTLVPTEPTVVPAGGIPITLSPTSSQVTEFNNTAAPTTSTIPVSPDGLFTEYALGRGSLPHEAVVDSSGDVWISEPGTNKIARLSLSPDFALSSSPPVVSLSQGGSTTVMVTGVSVSGYTGRVKLGTTTIPLGVTVSSFNPNPLDIPSGGTDSSQFVIRINPNASAGTNMLAIEGTDGTNTHVTSVMLLISNSTAPSPASGAPAIPGFTWESMIAGLIIGLGALGIARRRRHRLD